MIDRLIDEDAVRTSPIHFGLVMTELGSLRSVQCPIEDIPEGQLKDYMLASSACFPALRPREIDGVKYIDGGWRDNMPLDLAAKMAQRSCSASMWTASALCAPTPPPADAHRAQPLGFRSDAGL